MNGLFITFEGPEGAGKTTQVKHLAAFLEQQGLPVEILREPGGTGLGEKIREIVLNPAQQICAEAEVLLYAAARAQLVHTVIKPGLAKGKIMLCDRFVDASIAYQGGGRNLGAENVRQANNLAVAGIKPDLTILLDLGPEVGLNRVSKRETAPDRIERESLLFHQAVRKAYLNLATVEPERFLQIDATQPIENISQGINLRVHELLRKTGRLVS